jgi:hypothetical protein
MCVPFNHVASFPTPRFFQRIQETSEEGSARPGPRAFGNGSGGGASTPKSHGIHGIPFFLKAKLRLWHSFPPGPIGLIAS